MQWLHLCSLSLCLLLRPLPSLRPLPQLSYFHFWRFTFCPRTTYGRTTFLRPRGKAPARPPARIASCNRSFFVLSIALVPLCDRNNEMTRCLHLAVKENRRQIGEERTRRGGGIRKEENETFINEGEKRERTLTRWCKEHFGAITAILP